ncbi:hypothetical protein CRUP_000032, partial [Coryphaenoides rupestris]
MAHGGGPQAAAPAGAGGGRLEEPGGEPQRPLQHLRHQPPHLRGGYP